MSKYEGMESVEQVYGLASDNNSDHHHVICARCFPKSFTYINSFNSQHKLGSFIIFILHGEKLKHRKLSL